MGQNSFKMVQIGPKMAKNRARMAKNWLFIFEPNMYGAVRPIRTNGSFLAPHF